MPVIILTGRQGCGKGTFADIFCQYYKAVHISSGEILRKNKHREIFPRKKIQDFIENGEMIPDEFMIPFIEPYLRLGEKIILLDGFPRNQNQKRIVEKLCKEHNQEYITINFGIGKKKAIERITSFRKRSDDHSEALIKRMRYYEKETLPMLQEMKKKSDGIIFVKGFVSEKSGFEEAQEVFRHTEQTLKQKSIVLDPKYRLVI